MDAVTLDRLQFGTTIVYHYFFVPLTLGLALLIAIMESLFVVKKNPVYKQMAQFWGKLFLINFALGTATGIVQEFQFGMNWSAYSRFIGDIVGAPLAMETLLSFFLESTFLGIWIFGWDRLSPKLHLATNWLVVVGSYLSTFWILVANSFMQEPVGYVIKNGRAEMTSFWALLTNPNLWYQFPHVLAGGIATGAFFVIGISAYQFLRKTQAVEAFKRSMHIGLIVGFVSSMVAAVSGHIYGQHQVLNQPMKMAAAEALWNTAQPAPLSLISLSNPQTHQVIFSIEIPRLLSFLSYNNFTGKVLGINQLQLQYVKEYGPGNYIPDVNLSYYSFRLMMAMAIVMIGISALGLLLYHKDRLFKNRWVLRGMLASIATPYIANTFGWILGEVGRQPWTIVGLLKTANSFSPSVSASEVLATISAFIVLYIILGVADVFVLSKFAKKGISSAETSEEEQKERQLVVSY
jgi:cytochrome d ubiquinol oxidase subunit I